MDSKKPIKLNKLQIDFKLSSLYQAPISIQASSMYTAQTKEFNTEERSPPFPEPSAPPPPNYHYSDSSPVAIGIPLNSTNNQFHYPPTPNNNNNSNTFGVQSQSPVGWSTGLCDCCSDCNSCCLTCWCPCITFGRIADIVDKGSPSCAITGSIYTLLMFFTGCPCLLSCCYRTKIRGSYSLAGGSCSDCCLHCWCEECALCQEYRELKNKGFDMSIGWHGNMERQNHARASTAPRVPGGMTR